jgi:hypothetical protein
MKSGIGNGEGRREKGEGRRRRGRKEQLSVAKKGMRLRVLLLLFFPSFSTWKLIYQLATSERPRVVLRQITH